jgi:pantothenate kinase
MDQTRVPEQAIAEHAIPAAPVVVGLHELIGRAMALAARPSRTLLGIAGAPGSGKSTLARMLAAELRHCAAVVAMDGFHFSRERLVELGRLDRMGAIDTFDADRFIQLISRLREPGQDTVFAPAFSREREETLVDSVAIGPEVRLVIVEGNYLLVPDGRWGEFRDLLDEIWFCERDEAARLVDLIQRHQQYGKTPDHARAWALGPDQRNAELVAGTRDRSDLIVQVVLESGDSLVNAR